MLASLEGRGGQAAAGETSCPDAVSTLMLMPEHLPQTARPAVAAVELSSRADSALPRPSGRELSSSAANQNRPSPADAQPLA